MKESGRYNKLFQDFEEKPSEKVWKHIEQTLDEDRRKKAGYYMRWMIFFLFIGGLVTGSYLLLLSPNQQNAVKFEERDNESQKTMTENIIKQGSRESNLKTKISPPEKLNVSTGKVFSLESKNNFQRINTTHRNYISRDETAPLSKSADTGASQNDLSSPAIRNDSCKRAETLLASVDMPVIYFGMKERGLPLSMRINSYLSRWEIGISGGLEKNYRTITYKSPYDNTLNNFQKEIIEGNEKGKNTFSPSFRIGYRLNTQIKIFTGIGLKHDGQLKEKSQVILSYSDMLNRTNDIYSIPTSASRISLNGKEFDMAYFRNPDSSLFDHRFVSTLVPDTSKTVDFEMRQEFKMISIPLGVQYQFGHRRLSPFGTVFLSTDIIQSKKLWVNGMRLEHHYASDFRKWILTGGISAGLNFKVNYFLALNTELSYYRSLQPLVSDAEKSWTPSGTNIRAGITYTISR